MALELSSRQVNYLIWRYLQDEGLALSAYALDKEVDASSFESAKSVANDELVKLLLKGLQMRDIELNADLSSRSKEESKMEVDAIGEGEGEDRDAPKAPSNGKSVKDASDHQPITLPGGCSLIASQGVLAVGRSNASIVELYSDLQQPPLSLVASDDGQITCMDWQIGSRAIAVGDYDGQVRIWTRDGKLQRLLQASHKVPLVSLKWSPDGKLLGSVDCTNVVSVWDVTGGTVRRVLEVSQEHGTLTDIEWIDSRTYAVIYPTGIAVYKVQHDAATQTATGTKSGPAGQSAQSVAQSNPSGSSPQSLSTSHNSTNASITAAQQGQTGLGGQALGPTANTPVDSLPQPQHRSSPTLGSSAAFPTPTSVNNSPFWFKGHNRPVSVLCFDAVSQLLASGGDDGLVNIWHARSQTPIRVLQQKFAGPITAVAWIPGLASQALDMALIGSRLLAASTDGQVLLWDLNNVAEPIMWQVTISDAILLMEVNPSSSRVVVASADHRVRVYKLGAAQGKEVKPENTILLNEAAQALTWMNDNDLAVTTRKQTTVYEHAK